MDITKATVSLSMCACTASGGEFNATIQPDGNVSLSSYGEFSPQEMLEFVELIAAMVGIVRSAEQVLPKPVQPKPHRRTSAQSLRADNLTVNLTPFDVGETVEIVREPRLPVKAVVK